MKEKEKELRINHEKKCLNKDQKIKTSAKRINRERETKGKYIQSKRKMKHKT